LAPPAEGTDHSAHFNSTDSPQFQALNQLNLEIGSQLSSFPLSSSAGGFAYSFDADLGVLSRPTDSFGSVFGERPLTVGKGKYNIGVSVAEYTFDNLDGLDLREGEMQLVFTHVDIGGDGPLNPALEGDLVTSNLYINIETQITTLVGTYGVRDNFDVGIAIPVVDVSMQMSAETRVERVATGDRDIHIFPSGQDTEVVRRRGNASGVGDVLLRGKYVALQSGKNHVALSGDVRLPTGDDANLLGTGELQVKASLLGSIVNRTFSPHANLGVALSGGDISNEVVYGAGMSWAADPKLTVSADLVGRALMSVSRVKMEDEEFQYIEVDDTGGTVKSIVVPRLTVEDSESTVNLLHGAVGAKLNVGGNFLISMNGLFPLNDNGLTDKFSGLIGLDYSF
ncbi:MAG: hypothetical protein HKN21_12975, partial [Candidatus Eisenbacteria bacterium]|nr:hypothetical protein [Candidatus Eisenbacteria bacterium]